MDTAVQIALDEPAVAYRFASNGAVETFNDRKVERPQRTIEFRSFSNLINVPPEPEWLWRGYLAPGALTMLAGHPFAGKSMLVGGLLGAMNDGAEFLGRPTCEASGLVLSEEDEGALRQRAETLDLLKITSEYAARNTGALSSDWPALIQRAIERAMESGHKLLVVDTFPGLAGLAGDEENDAGAVGERLRPLQQAAGEGLAVLFLHHMNRFGQPRGSRAFSGVVDVSIRFLREGRSNRFRLTADSRFPTATPPTWMGQVVRDRPWRYESLEIGRQPTVGRRAKEDVREALLAAVAAAGPNGITYEEIDSRPGLSKDMAKRLLPAERGTTVEALGTGAKGDPYRWISLPTSDAVQSKSERS